DPAPIIEIPAAGRVGPAGVATGYPRTPQGAVGQLAAITVSVLQGMSIEHTRTVHHAWTHRDAPAVQGWALMGNVQSFLTAAGSHAHHARQWTVVVTPVAAQVKGVDGDDWVLACVLYLVEARIVTTARIGYGHCERMQWTTSSGDNGDTSAGGGSGRWVIGAGAPPARAPSTWPGTDVARQAGWLTWSPAEGQ
ncbi:MAG: hypothetical protein GXX79_19755, partial [Actinomycetales bacterium]|nr:hypothetical protein [Actinomycetales bacterium]